MEKEADIQQQLFSQPSPPLRVEREDVDSLDRVLRGYYLEQIKQIESRAERRKARKLVENHLLLPKSRQRTSKDAGYIREVVGIEAPLLAQLEESRLIRRVNRSGRNPIYEVSHDTLVEPILAERQRREAIRLFFRRYGWLFLLLLLFLFAFGMFFENSFDVVDDLLTLEAPPPSTVELQASNGIIAGKGTQARTLIVPFPDVKEFDRSDSLTLLVGVDVTAHPQLVQQEGQDTVSLNVGAIPLRLSPEVVQRLIKDGRDTAFPVRSMIPLGGADGKEGLMAEVGGMAVLQLEPEKQTRTRGGLSELTPSAARRTRGNDAPQPMQADLGRESVRVSTSARTVSLDTVVNLSDLMEGDQVAQELLKGRTVRLTYEVEVKPAVRQPENKEYVPVAGIEVQYKDGTTRFIPSGAGGGSQEIMHTVKPGETLFKISRLYGVSPDQIKQLNQLRGNTIKVGQELRIQ